MTVTQALIAKHCVLLTLIGTQIVWRGTAQLNRLHPDERPMIYASLGVLGYAFQNIAKAIAGIATIASIAWSLAHEPWYSTVLLVAVGGPLFALLQGRLCIRFPVNYADMLPGVWLPLAFWLVVLCQSVLWLWIP